MKSLRNKIAFLLVTSLALVLAPISSSVRFQETATSEKPLDQKFIQMQRIYERSRRAARYAARVKARYANDPKTASVAQNRYETAKDKFDGWLTLLGLAIVHKQKASMEGAQFKTIANEADKAANDFEGFAETLTRVEEPNPLTGQSAIAYETQSMSARNAGLAGGRGGFGAGDRASTGAGGRGMAGGAGAKTASGSPPPPQAQIVAEIIVAIGFSIYNKIQDRKAAERQQFVTDMREAVSWRDWSSIKADASIEALPAPKAVATPGSSPSPKASPGASPKPSATPKPTP
jgi:hypothetical protein